MRPSDILQGGFDPMNPATYREACPYCREVCECDLDHNGVGFVQVGPFHCWAGDRAARFWSTRYWFNPSRFCS
jgi:hypothetical protein